MAVGQARHDPVDRVGEDERHDDEDADPELALGEEDQRASDDSEGPDDGDEVGGGADLEQALGNGGEHARGSGPKESVQHGVSRVPTPGRPSGAGADAPCSGGPVLNDQLPGFLEKHR